jgi:MEDS: MEthanogen/methylotroph, DcmR Sensory domain
MCIAGQMSMPSSSSSLPLPSERKRLESYSYYYFYEKIAHYLSQGYAVIYVVESDITKAVINLSKICAIEVEEYIEKGALTLIDANSFYSPSETRFDWELLVAQWQKVISSVSKKGKFKKVMVMGMPHAAFFDSRENQQKLIEYEEQVAKHYDGGVQVFCCYTKELIDKLPLGYLLRLLAAHQDTAISNNNNNNNVNQGSFGRNSQNIPRMIDLIEEGLTEALGKETSALVLKTLKLIYKIDRDKIVWDPENFEEKMRRMIGKETADPVMRIIAERIKNEIVIQQ